MNRDEFVRSIAERFEATQELYPRAIGHWDIQAHGEPEGWTVGDLFRHLAQTAAATPAWLDDMLTTGRSGGVRQS